MNTLNCLKMSAALFCVIIFATTQSAFAQGSGSIRGTVIDTVTDEPLIGANVFIPEVSLGASTDIDGEFFIANVPEGTHTLRARYVGFKEGVEEVTVTAGETAEVDFRIDQTAVMMNELIVTGQGSGTERRKLTTTVSTIDLDEIEYAPVESLGDVLQGRVPGLSSFNSSGMPGTSGRIATRGIKSTISPGTPVVYVDNVRVDNGEAFRLALDTGGAETSALNDLVVGEIDRIEVIKGGAASTIYGSEAANGVIQIFTKKGTPGPARWKFTVTSGMDQPETQFTSEQFVKDNVLQNALYQSYEFGVSGGTPDFTYSVSGKMSDNKGIIVEDELESKMYSLASGLRVHLNEQMNLEVSTSYTKSQYGRIYNNNASTSPYSGFEDGGYGDQWGFTDEDRQEILDLMLVPDVGDDVDRFRLASNFDYTPIPTLTNLFTFGVDYRKNEDRDFVAKKGGAFQGIENGYLIRADREYLTISMGYTGSWTAPTFGPLEQKINFGAQAFRVEDRESTADGQDFAIPGTNDFDNAARVDAQESNRQLFNGGFFVVDQIGLFDKWFVDLGLRVDGNSAFGQDIGLQWYPKAGLAYNVSDEGFYPAALKQIVTTLKLRGSWGVTGNFPTPFTRDRTYGSQSFLGQSGITFNNPGNSDIKPEKTTSIDVGFDMGLFNDKILLEFNYFDQLTEDALFFVPRDPASGFDDQLTNVGEISNKGIELSMFAKVLHTENFSLTTKFSIATLENEVVSLGGAAPFTLASYTFLPRYVQEGYPVGTFRINVPVADANGEFTGDFEQKYDGNPMPKQYGSFGVNITLFKNLTVGAMLEYAFGHKFVNLKKTLRYFNQTEDAKDVVPEGYSFETASTVWLEDADWIKLREITMIYRLPFKFMNGVILSASVRNLAAFGVDSNNDPELNSFQPSGPNTGGYGFIDISAPKMYRLALTVNI